MGAGPAECIRGSRSGRRCDRQRRDPRPEDSVAGPRYIDVAQRSRDSIRTHRKRCLNGDRVVAHDRKVMPRPWQDENGADWRPGRRVSGDPKGVALGVQLANDLLEAADPRLHLAQHHARRPIKTQVDRPPIEPRKRRLDGSAPALVDAGEDRFDDTRLGRVADQWAGPSVGAQTKVRPKQGGGTIPNREANSRVASLEARDHSPIDLQSPTHRRLGQTRPQAQFCQLIAESGGLTAGLSITLANGNSIRRHACPYHSLEGGRGGCGWSAVGVGTQYIKTGFIAAYCRAAELELTLTTLGRA